MSALRRTLERRAAISYPTSDPYAIPAPGMLGGLTAAGTPVTERTAVSLTQVYRCVQILSDAVSNLPLVAYRRNSDGLAIRLDPQPPLLSNPFAQATMPEGLAQWTFSAALRGNALAVITGRDAALRASQLLVIHPDSTYIARDDKGLITYKVNNTEVDAADVVHVKAGLTPPGSLLGIGPLEAARNAFGLAMATEAYGSVFFKQGATHSGVVSVPGDLQPDAARFMAEQFAAKHTGLSKAHLPAVLTGGATWTPVSITPDDAQFLATRQFQAGEIATLFGVPPHLLGMVDKTTSWGTGIEIQGRAFVDYTLRPYLKRFEQAISALLPPGVWAEFDTDDITRADTTTRYAQYASGLTNGWMNVDYVLRQEKLPPLPNGEGQPYRHPVTITTAEVGPPTVPPADDAHPPEDK